MARTLQNILGAGLICYLRAEDASGAGDGGNVTSWVDRVNSIDFAEATDPPVYNADHNLSGYAAIDFGATTTAFLAANDANLNLSSGFEVLLCFAEMAATNLLTPISCFSSTSSYVRVRQITSSGTLALQDVGGFLGVGTYAVSDHTGRQVSTIRYQSGRCGGSGLDADGENLNNNGITHTETTGTSVAHSTWYLGKRGDSNTHQWGGALHAVAICQTGCDRRAIQEAATQLRYDFGISDSDSEPTEPASGGGIISVNMNGGIR